MRDDFQIPNMGTAEDKYDQSFLRRMVRNVETTFEALRAKGRAIFSEVTTDKLTVNGDVSITPPLPVASGGTGATDAAGARTNLDAQQQWPNLDAIGPLASAADTVPYFTGSGTAALTPLTSFGRSLIDDPDDVAGRATLKQVWEVVYDNTFTNVTSVPVTDLGDYRNLRIIVNAQTVTTANIMYFQMSSTNGSTWITGNDYGNYMIYHDESTATTVSGATSVTTGITTYRTIAPGNPLGLNWEMTITNFNKAGTHKMWGGHMVNYNATLVLHGNPTGRSQTSNLLVAMNAIRLNCATAMSGYMLIEGQRG